MSTKFSEHTRVLLRNRPRHLTLHDVASATGLTHAWLAKFVTNGVGQADRVETLYIYLTGEAPQLLPLHPKFLKD